MSLEITHIERAFRFKNMTLSDPSENFSVEMVKDFYSTQYPELTNATWQDKGIMGDKRVYEFNSKFGEKG